MTFFVAAGIAAVLALTSYRWFPALLVFLGFVEANSEVIEPLLSFAQLVAPYLWLAVSALLGFLGFRRLQDANSSGRAGQVVDASRGGRGVGVGGDVDRSVVIAGDNARVSVDFPGGITYDYEDITPSLVDSDTIERARRLLEELPLEEVPDRGSLPPGFVMPLRPNRYFVGREEQLRALAANLKAGDATAIGEVAVAASSGLGGVGKTQLACEFVYRYGRYFHGVYWLSFARPCGIPAEIASCGGAGRMELRRDFHLLPQEERVRAVMAEWQNELPWLLVFDNCEDEELLNQWLPPTGGARVLVTSRRAHWDPSLGVVDLPLDVLDRQESIELLCKHRPDLPADSPDLNAIADELGDLPLALDLAGRYLRRYHREITPDGYLAAIRRPDLLEHPSLREARGLSPTRHDMDVWRTFAVSYWRLDDADETDGTAVRLLARAARLAPGEPIPEGLLAWTLEPPDGGDTPPELTTTVRDALDRLADLGLLEDSGGEALTMHRLVAAFALAEVPGDDAQVTVEAACSRAARWASRQGQPAILEALLPHLRFVTDSAKDRVDAVQQFAAMASTRSLAESGLTTKAYLTRSAHGRSASSFTGQKTATPFSDAATWPGYSRAKGIGVGRGPSTRRCWRPKNAAWGGKTWTSPRPSTTSGPRLREMISITRRSDTTAGRCASERACGSGQGRTTRTGGRTPTRWPRATATWAHCSWTSDATVRRDPTSRARCGSWGTSSG